MISLNNLSRKLFKEFVDKYNLQQTDNRNVISLLDGRKAAFAIGETSTLECRQFYEDCDILYYYNLKDKKIYHAMKKDLTINESPNRITVGGIKTYTARAKKGMVTTLSI